MPNIRPMAKRVFTIPNIITMLRILMIPVFTILFLKGQLMAMLAVLFLSGMSDMMDGKIARRYNQISDMGKWLDPTADKLTQITLAVLLFFGFHGSENETMRSFSWAFLIFLVKELLMLIVALIMLILKKRPAAAEIYGKVATTVFYIVVALLFFAAPDVGLLIKYDIWAMPNWAVVVLTIITLVLTIIAFISYIPDTYRKVFNKEKKG